MKRRNCRSMVVGHSTDSKMADRLSSSTHGPQTRCLGPLVRELAVPKSDGRVGTKREARQRQCGYRSS